MHCIHMDVTRTQSPQKAEHFLRFQGNLCLRSGFPFKSAFAWALGCLANSRTLYPKTHADQGTNRLASSSLEWTGLADTSLSKCAEIVLGRAGVDTNHGTLTCVSQCPEDTSTCPATERFQATSSYPTPSSLEIVQAHPPPLPPTT